MRFTPSRILRAASALKPKSYSSTLHLPKSTFPARPPIRKPSPYLGAVAEDLYTWNITRKYDQVRGTFVLHDGPPYANGSLHIGHALNKISKDIINRFQLSQGQRVHYTPGWDCHGLPIEIKALQSRSGRDVSPVEVRRAARALAEKTISQQMDGFKSWGVMGDWANAYKTMDKSFELRQLAVVKRMVEKGLIYRQHKPVYWSPSSQTALAESELEYMDDHKSTAAYVAFPIKEPPPHSQDPALFEEASAVIWTTTPWTLPANKAIAVNEQLSYCLIELLSDDGQRQRLIVEESCLEDFGTRIQNQSLTQIATSIPGHQLVGTKYENPLHPGCDQTILHADFVASSSGTGLVHMAPGHGMDDYEVCMRNSIVAFAPVDDEGRFTEQAYPHHPALLTGKHVQSDGIVAVLNLLETLGERQSTRFLLSTHELRHRYPIDWRTKQPVIIRATEQWFANVDGIKAVALTAIDNVRFIPEKGRSRLESFTKSRNLWCISRQRAWGVPIPALYRVDDGSNAAVMTPDTISHIMDVIHERGTDAWWTDKEDDRHWVPSWLQGDYMRGKDTMDVWFDSGTTWTMLDQRPGAQPIADVYLEGSDQHRGWFQSSLLTYVADQAASSDTATVRASDSKAPFRTLITHGFTLDQDGKKMSKSIGNVVSPDQIMDGSLLTPVQKKGKKHQSSTSTKPTFDGMGPDALRLWAATSDFTSDVLIGTQVLENVNKSLAKYRITFKWLLGALAKYEPSTSGEIEFARLSDNIALQQLSSISAAVHSAFSNFEVFRATKLLDNYVNADLSAVYFETLKDRLYAGLPEDRRAAQATLWHIFNELLAMLSPITPFMVEEVWQHTPENLRLLNPVPPLRREWTPYRHPRHAAEPAKLEQLQKQMEEVRVLHEGVRAAAEAARRAGKMGTTLDCDVELHIPMDFSPPAWSVVRPAAGLDLAKQEEELASQLVVSSFDVCTMLDDVHEMLQSGMPSIENGNWRYPAKLSMPGWGNVDILLTVGRPLGDKCMRCWRWVVDEEKAGEKLCERCEEAINLQQGGGSA